MLQDWKTGLTLTLPVVAGAAAILVGLVWTIGTRMRGR
jgi:hypothetical protein